MARCAAATPGRRPAPTRGASGMIWSPSAGRLSNRLIRVTTLTPSGATLIDPLRRELPIHPDGDHSFCVRNIYGHDGHSHGHVRLPGVTCAAPPTRPFPRPGRSRQEAGHSPVGSDVSWTLGSPAVRSPGTTIGSAASYEQPAPILAYWAAPSHPDAVGARNGSQRVQTSPDAARCNQNLLAGEGLPVRLSPMVTDTPEFPDTEEVTGSNPVRPTVFRNLV